MHNAAASDRQGHLRLRLEPLHDMSRVVTDEEGDSVEVEAVRLDDVVGAERVHGIKIDVEGYELQALTGARTLVERDQPWLCVEFNTNLAGTHVVGEWPVYRFLAGLGYQCRRFADVLDESAEMLDEAWVTPLGHVDL